MPYSRLSRGTDAHHEYVLTDSPWLEDFLEICVHPNDDTFSSNQQLFDCYQRYIRFKDLTAQVNDIASGRRRFFNSLARWRRQNPGKLVQVNCNKAKGYNVWLFKMPRRCAVPELTSTSEEMKTYVATPLEERPVLVHRRYVSENIGYGAFAKDTIPSGTVVTEYFGHTVDAVTAIQRDDEYKARGLPAAMFMVGRNQFVDPYDPQCVIKAIDNQGVWLNHGKDANCKSYLVNHVDGKHILLATVKDVPRNYQLFHDYNDSRRGVPEFLKK